MIHRLRCIAVFDDTWAGYMDIIQMVLTLIRATKKTTLNCMQLYLYALFLMFIANDHNNYAEYVPVYLITLINLSDTHRRCKELEQNRSIVTQPLVLCLRNAFDITIR